MPKEVMTTLKTYCESGMFARGRENLQGRASLALFGNTNQPVDVLVKTSHLFAPMPSHVRNDMAFLDRLHFYLPGWEMPKMENRFLTSHYGFVVDYLAEAFKEIRKQNFTEIVDRFFRLGSHLNTRDVKAVRKTVSGFIKLMNPSGNVDRKGNDLGARQRYFGIDMILSMTNFAIFSIRKMYMAQTSPAKPSLAGIGVGQS
jgi:ATP-dependent Lon protease